MRPVALALALLAGPAASQTLVADLRPGPESSSPTPIEELGNALVFSARDASGYGLFATTGDGAVRLADGFAGFQGARLGADLFFLRASHLAPDELWRTDGTPGGTARVAVLPDGVTGAGYFAATADRVFFLARGASGTELWTSDGTATRRVEGAAPARNDGLRYIVTAQPGRVLFSAESGSTLWASDGVGASRLVRFGDGREGRGAFFYGTALGVRDEAFALVPEADPAGLYRVDARGASVVAELNVGTSNQTLVRFGSGALFGAYEASPPGSPDPVRFYAVGASGVRAITPALPATDLRDHAVTSRLADGTVALAVSGSDGTSEVWRATPEAGAAFAFALPAGEMPISSPGQFNVSRENRRSPAVALADGALHALTYTEDENSYASFSLWRDAGDGTATRLATYAATETSEPPSFATAGGRLYVVLETGRAGRELFELGLVGTSAEPEPADGLSLALRGPNPASGEVRVGVTAPLGERVRVEAFTATGRRVATLHDGVAPEAALALDVSGLAPGVYVVRALGASGAALLRVAVAR